MNNLKIKSIGKILSKARKSMNLTKKDIANKLCLKLNIINNIENDFLPNNIPIVFFRGYIFSYARLVNISNKKIIFLLEKYNFNDSFRKNIFKKKSYININNFFLFIKIFFFIKLFFLFSIGFIYFINIKNKDYFYNYINNTNINT